MLTTLGEWLRLMAVAQIAVFSILLARDHGRNRSARVTVAFLVGATAYILLPIALTHGAPMWFFHVLFVISATVPFWFWLLGRVHFADAPRTPFAAWALPFALIASSYLMALSYDGELRVHYSDAALTFVRLLPRVLGGVLVLHAAYLVLQGVRTELVSGRLKMRYLFLGTSGACVLAVLAGEALLMTEHAEVPDAAQFSIALAIFALSFFYSLVFGSVSDRVLSPTPVEQRPIDPELRRRFEQLMEESIYRESGLTIRKLAERVGDSEASVRTLINSDLGFKNFSAFLNHYRIEDAKLFLQDADTDSRTIAEIAFELGYQSLGPFNKAFRELSGKTPSEYRKQTSLTD